MSDVALRLDPKLGHTSGAVPGDLVEDFSRDGSPISLQSDVQFASLPPPPAPVPGLDWDQLWSSLHSVLLDSVTLLQWLFLLYFLFLNGGYLLLNLSALLGRARHQREHGASILPRAYAEYELPISIIVPVCDQEGSIVETVRALLQLSYPKFELIVVNDGSSDRTLDVLIAEFGFTPFPEAYRDRLQTKLVKTIYASTVHPRLRLLDKDGGGRADALNAGINCARYPLFCGVDSGAVLQRDGLHRLVRPFLESSAHVAVFGAVRVLNGCTVKGGFLTRVGLSRKWLVLFQIIEQLRVSQFALLGWSSFNALLLVPHAFGLFRKEAVVAAGGYRSDAAHEDMALVARLHRWLRDEGKPYRMSFVSDPVCWATVAETTAALKLQRRRWQLGVAESLARGWKLAFSRGVLGWLAYPFALLFERLGPAIELIGYGSMTLLWLFSLISWQAFCAFMLVAVGLGILLSVSSLLLEEVWFHLYPGHRGLLRLLAAAVLENFGFRQVSAWWRLFYFARRTTGQDKLKKTLAWRKG